MSNPVSLEKRGDIALITVNNPPVNALSAAVRGGLADAFTEADQDDSVKAIVLACEGRTFIAGADITEFGKPMQPPSLPEVLGVMDKVGKPTVAALHGTALGGGLETALSCHYRIAVPAARVGLPEVKLGVLPGAGGTQRLPRLIGVEKSLEIIISGRQIKAPEAVELGVIDRLADGDLLDDALTYAKELVASNAPVRRISEQDVDTSALPENFFDDYRKATAKKLRGFEAPQACIDAVELSTHVPFAEGMTQERELFIKMMNSTQSQAQRHIFFAERQAAVIADIPKDTPLREVSKVAIIGGGTMGTGIAMNFLNAGIPVTLLEMNHDGLDKGLGTIGAYYQDRIKKGRMSQAQAEGTNALVTGTLSYDDLGDVDLVIEAVFENMEIKRTVFGELDRVCKPGAILASNTSTLDVDQIAAATQRPEDVCGLHFFSPAQVMRLLEIVRADKTADDVMATVMKLARTIGKVGVVSGVCDGFIGNRMLKGYGREAGALTLEGASPAQIDKAIYGWGMAMGPMAMGDLAGLDVGYRVRQERRARGEVIPPGDGAIADRLVEMGRMGQKTQKGYYRYEPGSRAPLPDPEVDEVIRAAQAELGIESRDISDEEIIERLILPLINEAALILEEGIAQRPADVDVVWVYGYGFPVHRGGPMFYADTLGLPHVLERLKSYQASHGDVWQPAPLIERLVAEGKSFSDL